jgi:diaminopimelate epimerase
MTQLTLTKHQALGNDFLVVFDPPDADLAALARRVCHRRRGIGADGLLVGTSVDGFDAQMVLFNADGSRAEMSGNGIRCFAQALASRLGRAGELRVLTDSGARLVAITPSEEGPAAARIEAAVDMGEVADIDEPADWHRIGTDPHRPVRHLSVGNPHAVVGVEDVAVVDLIAIGAIVPHVNVEIIEPGPETHAVTMRVHERGAGITEACGTGACASAWAAATWGLVPASATEILVHMDGGDAKVRLHEPSTGRVTLIGPAERIATITIDLADIGVEKSTQRT